MTLEEKRSFVTAMAAQHGPRLRRFLLARVRNAADASDLVQEVYLRLLRVEHHESIRMPEAYIIALANHVLYQYRLKASRAIEPAELADALEHAQALHDNEPQLKSETRQHLDEVQLVLQSLSPKAQAAMTLHWRDGLTLNEVAERLGVSRHMVKKYLAKALLTCRQRLDAGGQERP